jgi:chromosomal replication initiator protein
VPRQGAAAHPWDGFLVGPENSLAHAAVLALARGDGAASPLVLHGPSGAGKSRLLAGLIAEFVERHPGASVAHLAGEAFAALCAEAATHQEGWAELRARFRSLDLFVLDDLRALERITSAQAELSHILDALSESGAAVAVAASSPPSQWSAAHARGAAALWPARLLSRLQGGLAIGLSPPGVVLRRRYVLDRAQARRLVLGADAIDLLCEKADGYRTIDGWVAKLVLQTRLEARSTVARSRALGREQIEPLLRDEFGHQPTEDDEERAKQSAAVRGVVLIDPIARAVARRFGVTLRELRGPSRRAWIVMPRHLAIYLARRWTRLSFNTLGHYFGRRDTKTIRHACQATEARLRDDPALAAAADALGAALHRGGLVALEGAEALEHRET